MRSYDVIVAGAGASGMMAAISAARRGARTALLEHMDQAGKKLLSTGNGKCNFTNQVQGMEYYRGLDPAFVLPVFAQFGVADTLDFFRDIGVWWKEKRGGSIYPANEQSSTVREGLLLELARLGVELFCGIGIRSIQKRQGRFLFDTKQGEFSSSCCVLATGGKAAKKTGSDGSGIPYVVGFCHPVSDFVPALVQLQGKQSFLKELAGIRAQGRVSVYVNGTKTAEDVGELQLTEFGVSGIPAFQVSRYCTTALARGEKVSASLDFMPDTSEDALLEDFYRQRKRTPEREAVQWLSGIVNRKLSPVLLKQAGLSPGRPLGEISRKQLLRLTGQIKGLLVDIIGSKSFDGAQVCAGGVLTEKISPKTMESRLVEGLYFAGELVDIDGMCGGYNLQWAFSSGWVAGLHSADASRGRGRSPQKPEMHRKSQGGTP